MRRVIVGLAIGLAMAILPNAFATHVTQTVEGDVLVGNPASCCTGGVNEILGPSQNDGIDGVWITLDVVSTGVQTAGVVVTDDSGLSDFDVYFYDSGGSYIRDTSCAASFGPSESCAVPVDAAFAIVDLFLGAQGGFSFTYNY